MLFHSAELLEEAGIYAGSGNACGKETGDYLGAFVDAAFLDLLVYAVGADYLAHGSLAAGEDALIYGKILYFEQVRISRNAFALAQYQYIVRYDKLTADIAYLTAADNAELGL